MAQCPQCAQPLANANARFCNCCGTPLSQSQGRGQASTNTIAAVAGACRYIRSHFDVQLHDAPKGKVTSYYTSHHETYAVMEEQPGWYKLRLGGGQTGWVQAKHCEDVSNGASKLSIPIPSVLVAKNDHFVWATFEPMPLAQISYDSSDYRLMYAWIGSHAAREPNVTGYVRSCQQIGTRTIGQANSYRQSDTEATTVSYSATIHAYQMMVEDNRGARRTVTFEQPPVSFVPQVGDYLVIWGTVNQNGICELLQGIRRDLHDSSSGSIMLAPGLATRKEPPFNWLPVLIILAVIVLLGILTVTGAIF